MTPERSAIIAELAGILGVNPDDVPVVFRVKQVKVLKIGIDVDLRIRYPAADPERLADWLQRYTTSEFYLRRTINKFAHNRHDLDGGDVEPIKQGARYRAFRILNEMKQKLLVA